MVIEIGSFSLERKEWEEVDSLNYFKVNVIETSGGDSIVTSGTYFIRNGVPVSTTYSGIPNGYECRYYPTSLSSSGTIYLDFRAESTSGEVKFEHYELLYGYHLLFDEIVNWNPNQEVVVSIYVQNSVICPNVESKSFSFETKDLQSTALQASIRPIASVDLVASIYPQDAIFYYGGTYTITISGVRDFSGNELEPFSFTFTIENPT